MATFCNLCGHQNADGSQFCGKCGQPLGSASASVGAFGAPPPLDPTASPFPQPSASGAPVVTDPNAPTDAKAVASLILGILSLTIFPIIAGIPAIILGHVSRSAIKKSLGRLKGEGMALAGLIMGYLSFAALPVILIIAAIAIPNLLRARISANESSAVRSIRTINATALAYQASNDNQAFPNDLREMKATNIPGDYQVTDDLAGGSKAGYTFTYTPIDSDGDKVTEGYFVSASPLTPGSTGVRSFCSDQTGVIRVADRNESCTVESPPI